MKFYDVTFFSDNEPPNAHAYLLSGEPTVRLTDSESNYNSTSTITIHLKSELDLIRFKNNVHWACENLLREMANKRKEVK